MFNTISFRVVSFGFVSMHHPPPPTPGFRCVQATDPNLQERKASGGWFHILRLLGAVRDSPRLQVRVVCQAYRTQELVVRRSIILAIEVVR